MRLLIAALLLVSLSCSTVAGAKPRVLRRKRADKSYIQDSTCPTSAKMWMFIAGERTSSENDFIAHNPELVKHREILNYGDEEIEEFFQEAAEFVLEKVGVDFTGVTRDASGMMTTPDGQWTLMGVDARFNIKIVFSSITGDTTGCPLPFYGELIVLVPNKEGVYHGTYGGVEGRRALPGDMLAYGHYMIDFYGDFSRIEVITLRSKFPLRATEESGSFINQMDLYSDLWGVGRSSGVIDFIPALGGAMHGSSRAAISFPGYWDIV